MENYEKKYEKLVDAVKVLRDNNPSDEGIKNWVNDNVPELKESEDEKIRKTLIEYFNAYPKDYYCELKTSCIIAWLEKQGEQKHAEWHKEDEQNLNACLGYIPDEYLCRWLKDVIHVKYDNPAWNEEDEVRLTNIIIMLKEGASHHFVKGDITNSVDWLKSLKERMKLQWKPSEEQLKALNAINVTGGVSYAGQGQELINLYNDLKKLREE